MDLIQEIYSEIYKKGVPITSKAELYYSLLFIKSNEGITDNYSDAKYFIKYYIGSIDDKTFGYDNLNIEKINGCLYLFGHEQRLFLYKFLKKNLVKYHFEKEWKVFETAFYKCQNAILIEKKFWYLHPISIVKFAYNKTIYSYKYLFLLFLFVILTDYLLLLPNPFSFDISLFKIKYQEICNPFPLNHLANILLGLLEIDSDFKVIPLNFLGTIFILVGKILKTVFVVKYLADKIVNKLDIDEL